MLSFTALKERLGAKEADRLLVRVCLEAALAYPIQTARLLTQRMVAVYFDPWMLAVPMHPQFQPGTFQSPLADEIADAGDYAQASASDYAIDRNLRWLMRAAILMAVIALPIALRYSSLLRVAIALLIFFFFLNIKVAVGNLALFRYAFYAVPLNLWCGL